MGKGRKSGHRHKSRASSAEAGMGTSSGGSGVSGIISKLPHPVIGGLAALQLVFGVVFILIGALNTQRCRVAPMLPIWLIIMGLVYVGTGVYEYYQYRVFKKNPHRSSGTMDLVITGLVAFITVGLLIAGNVWIFMAWGQSPDYGHHWFENSCDMACFFTAFVGVIIMDALFGLMLIGTLFYAAASCVSK